MRVIGLLVWCLGNHMLGMCLAYLMVIMLECILLSWNWLRKKEKLPLLDFWDKGSSHRDFNDLEDSNGERNFNNPRRQTKLVLHWILVQLLSITPCDMVKLHIDIGNQPYVGMVREHKVVFHKILESWLKLWFL